MVNFDSIKKALKKKLDEAQEQFDSMEIKSAPSGEWAEYNYQYMIQEAVVQTLEEAYTIVNCNKD